MTSRLFIAVLLFAAALPALAIEQLVLLRSEQTAEFMRANGGDYDKLIVPWRGFFSRQGLKVRELRAAELASVKQPAVLILASPVPLPQAERQAIRARVAAGGAGLGSHAGRGRGGKRGLRGYGFSQERLRVQGRPEPARAA